MPKQEDRGSLMGLKANLPSVPKVPAIHATPEMEQGILGAEGQLSADHDHKDVSTYVKSSSSFGHAGLVGQRKEPTVLLNAKLPVSLHTRLKRTAQFNDLTMTDILLRALEIELDSGRYTAPPDAWGAK